MRLTGNVTCVREIRNSYKILMEDLKGRIHFGYLGVDRRIKLKFI
jgi:hypothetical protein